MSDVPDAVYAKLKSRAAREGMSLSDFIKRQLERVAQRPTMPETMQEWLERPQQAKPIPSKQTATQIIRELRGER